MDNSEVNKASILTEAVELTQVDLGQIPSAVVEVPVDQEDATNDAHHLHKYTPPVGFGNTRHVSNLCVNLTIFAQWSNLLMLPAIYDKLGQDLGFSTTQLGLLHTMRIFSMFITLPIYAILCYRMSRRVLVSYTMALSGVFTILTIFCKSYGAFMTLNVLAGISLGAVAPVARSLIPNYYELAERGAHFGYLELAAGIGGFLGVGLATGITTGTGAWGARASETLGICCFPWQTVFIVLGLLMFPCAMVVYKYLVDPVHDAGFRKRVGDDILLVFPGLEGGTDPPTRQEIKELWNSITFRCIVLQGATGAFPWSGISFLILWFERMCVESILAVVIFAMVGLGAAIGGALGGLFGDVLYRSDKVKWGEKYGRITVAHVSVFMGIPLIAVLMQAIPKEHQYWGTYALVGGFMGITISWPPGNNSSNHSDVFPQKVHPTSFAIQYWVEGCVSSWSPFLVGLLTDYAFGAIDHVPVEGEEEYCTNLDTETVKYPQEWLQAMANSVTTVAVVMWTLCFFCYVPMYKSYPRESLSLKKAREARETKDVESDLKGKGVESDLKGKGAQQHEHQRKPINVEPEKSREPSMDMANV